MIHKTEDISPFREFFHKEEIDFSNLDSNTIVIFDTNTLLNIYRYSNNTRKKLIDAMTTIKENIWLPYQVGLEFNLHRKKMIIDLKEEKNTRKKFFQEEINKYIECLKTKINSINIKSNDAKEKKDEINNFIKNRLEELNENLSEKINELENMVDLDHDLASEIAELFKERIGVSYSQEELDEKLKDAEERYKNQIPPGYKDNSKNEEYTYYNDIKFLKKYGDLIIWYQIIEKAKTTEINKVIFVTDDNKADWWYIYHGKTLGPRAELKNEILRESKSDLYMINANTFLKNFSDGEDLIDFNFDLDFNLDDYNDTTDSFVQANFTDFDILLQSNSDVQANFTDFDILLQSNSDENKDANYNSDRIINLENKIKILEYEKISLKEKIYNSNDKLEKKAIKRKLKKIDQEIFKQKINLINLQI